MCCFAFFRGTKINWKALMVSSISPPNPNRVSSLEGLLISPVRRFSLNLSSQSLHVSLSSNSVFLSRSRTTEQGICRSLSLSTLRLCLCLSLSLYFNFCLSRITASVSLDLCLSRLIVIVSVSRLCLCFCK